MLGLTVGVAVRVSVVDGVGVSLPDLLEVAV